MGITLTIYCPQTRNFRIPSCHQHKVSSISNLQTRASNNTYNNMLSLQSIAIIILWLKLFLAPKWTSGVQRLEQMLSHAWKFGLVDQSTKMTSNYTFIVLSISEESDYQPTGLIQTLPDLVSFLCHHPAIFFIHIRETLGMRLMLIVG